MAELSCDFSMTLIFFAEEEAEEGPPCQ